LSLNLQGAEAYGQPPVSGKTTKACEERKKIGVDTIGKMKKVLRQRKPSKCSFTKLKIVKQNTSSDDIRSETVSSVVSRDPKLRASSPNNLILISQGTAYHDHGGIAGGATRNGLAPESSSFGQTPCSNYDINSGLPLCLRDQDHVIPVLPFDQINSIADSDGDHEQIQPCMTLTVPIEQSAEETSFNDLRDETNSGDEVTDLLLT